MEEDAKTFLAEAARLLARRLRVEARAPGFLPVRESPPTPAGPARPAREPASTWRSRLPVSRSPDDREREAPEPRPVWGRGTPAEPPQPPPPLPDDLDALARVVAECRRCPLHATRTLTVFGEGRVGCDVMFVGEGPGAEEDATGRPFVGAAGRLLDRMIAAMGLVREDCYIANVVKCRPPHNATPSPAEAGACRPYLERQIELVRPRVLVALGRSAAVVLTGRQEAVAHLRGTWFRHPVSGGSPSGGRVLDDIPVLVTYHPAALLRNPDYKPQAWRDLQLVMARVGKVAPSKGERDPTAGR